MPIWRNIVNCSNIDFVRDAFAKDLLEVVCIFEAQIAAVDVVSERERKLSLVEVGRVGAIVQTCQSKLVSLDHFAVA